jgi:hypothetical protein
MDDEPMTDETRSPAHLRQEAPPEVQEQAAREQAVERMQVDVDAAGIDATPPEPKDTLDLPSQERIFEQSTRRATQT